MFVKGENGFPLQITYFPVGSPVSLSHGSQVAFHSIKMLTFFAKVQVEDVVTHHFSTLKIRGYLLSYNINNGLFCSGKDTFAEWLIGAEPTSLLGD